MTYPYGSPGTSVFPTPVTGPAAASAINALVFGILAVFIGWFSCGLMALFAIISGHVGLKATRYGARPGRGMAVTGLILGYVMLLPNALIYPALFPAQTARIVRDFTDFFQAL
ncbi:hypothetical protein F4553_002931 [Allocatelliglobosispora scoriae]|uniref:DUF4190 domain-containing protein n=1 Tax=Allocatelliglobosispora scoriae TaxID=643052 RepID=A0A841BS45_9ACTN|nr:DUF4190 domain-containing protein [Allocatelliglobosispora scoriae]MBB5869552.1 hypothetical protein [Allocatelliglobosispora scoriae]